MSSKRRNRILVALGLVTIFIVLFYALQPAPSCCALPPLVSLSLKLTTTAVIDRNQTTEAQIHKTETQAFVDGLWLTATPTPNPFPYDPTLYAQRQEEIDLLGANYSTAYWQLFYFTETAIVTNYDKATKSSSTPTADTLP